MSIGPGQIFKLLQSMTAARMAGEFHTSADNGDRPHTAPLRSLTPSQVPQSKGAFPAAADWGKGEGAAFQPRISVDPARSVAHLRVPDRALLATLGSVDTAQIMTHRASGPLNPQVAQTAHASQIHDVAGIRASRSDRTAMELPGPARQLSAATPSTAPEGAKSNTRGGPNPAALAVEGMTKPPNAKPTDTPIRPAPATISTPAEPQRPQQAQRTSEAAASTAPVPQGGDVRTASSAAIPTDITGAQALTPKPAPKGPPIQADPPATTPVGKAPAAPNLKQSGEPRAQPPPDRTLPPTAASAPQAAAPMQVPSSAGPGSITPVEAAQMVLATGQTQAASVALGVIFNAAFMPGWPFPTAWVRAGPHAAPDPDHKIAEPGTTGAMTPEEAAQYLAQIAGGHIALRRLRKLLKELDSKGAPGVMDLLVSFLAICKTIEDGLKELFEQLAQGQDLRDLAAQDIRDARNRGGKRDRLDL